MSVSSVCIVFIHIQSCTLYYIGKLVEFKDWDHQFSHWASYPGGIRAASNAERYLWMSSQSIGNMFPLTYEPETVAEQIATLIFISVGAVLYAILIGLISSAAISFDAPGKLYRQKIDELTEYISWKNIDKKTSKKLLQYYDLKYRGKYFEETTILAGLNNSLQREVASINCRKLIEKVPFLERSVGDGRDDIFLGKLAMALVPVCYLAGDFIFNQGEKSTEMFFILSGTVNIIVNGTVVSSCSDGSFFGEVALIANMPRTASIQAVTSCNVYSLSADDFNDILLDYKDIRDRIDLIYEERMSKIRVEQGLPARTTLVQSNFQSLLE
ncbi:camp-binding domain-like protein [Rhizoclosmatium globosum]|uniref:Camp-binding domain-like protein n=1 Tax=Rhizoclosmatium globosum TaxID=329046 RepID=A0A1Y2BYZ8_9FUNG|nr:camp-binding domain-like protein [Rhizoclosmatium globosum]|eukprot:ORY39904.1 camp-binding domain-like protein [Rhizoclosmatium globosum]